jgi:hypothetical protein
MPERIDAQNWKETEMEQGMNGFDTAHWPVGIGRLIELRSLEARPKQTVGMPVATQVLACPVAPPAAHWFSKGNGQANFGFGHIPREDGLLMTIRAQIGGLQVYWIAEMADPEVWAAIDKWRRVKRAPVMFEIREGARSDKVFGVFDVPLGTLHNEAYRHRPDPVPTAQRLHSIVSFVGSGALQLPASTDMAGVQLRQVLTNVIVTKRLEPFVKASPVPA